MLVATPFDDADVWTTGFAARLWQPRNSTRACDLDTSDDDSFDAFHFNKPLSTTANNSFQAQKSIKKPTSWTALGPLFAASNYRNFFLFLRIWSCTFSTTSTKRHSCLTGWY
ncbi:unnamed protein product [Caenorhabditis auriculariae]|uniref:Uncharacterized protein n=1 Tax=Caenorhabditis auriculariae TaxID=2777116 RepID=A0A8S1HCH3_9PELO|nr:unnamed protein product [Caenorhabditis auriculariae]